MKEENEITCHVDDCSACHIDVREEVSDEVWWDDEGEADEEEEADEDQEVRGEEGASQVSVVGDTGWFNYKWCAYSSCNCSKQTLIAIVVIVLLCNDKRNDNVGDEKYGGRDGGVVLQEGGGQREA